MANLLRLEQFQSELIQLFALVMPVDWTINTSFMDTEIGYDDKQHYTETHSMLPCYGVLKAFHMWSAKLFWGRGGADVNYVKTWNDNETYHSTLLLQITKMS